MKISRDAVLAYSIRYRGEWSLIAKALKEKEPFERLEYKGNFVTVFDQDYPSCFLRLRYPPWILFYQGNPTLLKKHPVGIVGARKCTQAALNNTREIVSSLKERHTIVSGLAKGIDAQAHRCALDQQTVGIIGCGLDRIYPKENAPLYHAMGRDHCILSEYPPGSPPLAKHFPWRNRLIAACIDALVVVQAEYKSGTMLTVDACNELSVPVYCVPSGFEQETFQGCNYLISCGAQILLKEDLERI